ncbi:hypothetical protein PpBr36_02882 [Pyricularia pennisetigena]|uniref:hypothetical protein n=1 Tax=Pyricularia pennisetigena TaxID=1578925 RepID=UPI0011507D1B|nr:hypothetical protein PpBr36_02882 [Pyricularia pennisetigena]TLS30342.1 hypothetical protein PpBr36_02882 [Pyricularia pennisetigena]
MNCLGLSSRKMLCHSYSLAQHRNRVMLAALRRPASAFSTAAIVMQRVPARPQTRQRPPQKQLASDTPIQEARQLVMASILPDQPRGYIRTGRFTYRLILWGVFVGPCLVVFYWWASAKVKASKGDGSQLKWMRENFTLSRKNLDEGRWWTLITSAFSHMDPMHLLFNMLTLRFGVEAALAVGLGPLRVLFLATGAALSSSYAGLWDEETRKHGVERAGLGASGIVQGFLATMALTRPWMQVSLMFIPVPVSLPLVWGLFAIWDFYNLSMARQHGDSPSASGSVVGYAAHLGGSAFGALYWLVRLKPVFGGETQEEPNAWMARIPDDRPINHLSIPGTHDSCARSQVIYVQTQTQTVTEQLLAGVRALDLRLRRRHNGQLFCYHGGVPLGPFGRPLALSAVMAEVWAFMIRTRFTETVLVSIDNDDPADRGSAEGRQGFYEAVDGFIRQTPRWGKGEGGVAGPDGGEGSSRWYLAPQTPTLGEVRGKAVLLRRFAAEGGHRTSSRAAHGESSSEYPKTADGIGFDLSAWVNNSPDFIIQTPHARFRIQDRWKYSERIQLADLIESKTDLVKNLMDQAIRQEREPELLDATPHHDSWFIHFTSAVGEPFKHGEIATARSIAVGDFVGWGKWQDGVNVAIAQFIKQYAPSGRRQRLGVVFMDFAVLPEDAELLDSIIATNFSSIGEAAMV